MTKQAITCPVCGHPRADMTRLPGRDEPLLGCFSCEADGLSGGDWLRTAAEKVGAPGGGALKADPERWLAPYINGTFRRGVPAELPTVAKLTGWNAALLSHKRALGYVRNEYGLRRDTIARYAVGYAEHGAPGKYREYAAYTLPVFNADGDIVNLRKRFWPETPRDKYVGLGGRGSQLYPDMPETGAQTAFDAILVAGEFDALVGRQLRLPTVSTTCGARLPEELASEFAGYRVVVMYDVGEERAARRSVEVLLGAGASEAWVVRLPMRRKGADLSSWYSSGGHRNDLLKVITRPGLSN